MPSCFLGALAVEGGDRTKAGWTEPKAAERSQWRGGCHSLGACRELQGGRAGHGVGLDQTTPSPSSFTASLEALSPKASTVFRSLTLEGDRNGCSGELLAASCVVQLLPFFRIFPSLEHQGKLSWEQSWELLCTLHLFLHIPVQLCSGGTSGNVSKELEKIPGVLFSWLCKNSSAYQATQRNVKIFTRSSCGLSFEF